MDGELNAPSPCLFVCLSDAVVESQYWFPGMVKLGDCMQLKANRIAYLPTYLGTANQGKSDRVRREAEVSFLQG